MIVAFELFMDGDVCFCRQNSTVLTQDIRVVVMNQRMLPHISPLYFRTVFTELRQRAATHRVLQTLDRLLHFVIQAKPHNARVDLMRMYRSVLGFESQLGLRTKCLMHALHPCDGGATSSQRDSSCMLSKSHRTSYLRSESEMELDLSRFGLGTPLQFWFL